MKADEKQQARRIEHVIPAAAVEQGTYKIFIEVSCNGLFGAGMNGLGWAPPDVSTLTTPFTETKMNLHFPLLSADILLPNIPVRDMHADFRALRQIAASTENRASDLSRRALKAANNLVNAFHRVEGDEKNPDLLLPVIDECRKIAWGILGPLSESDRAKLAPSDSKVQADAKVWAIGHW